MKFKIDKRIFERYENLKIGVVLCRGIKNDGSIDLALEMENIKRNITEKFQTIELSDHPVIRTWRDIYKDFGEKKCRSSVESLIRRVVNGKEMPSINPLVDLYNFVSLKYELPCGGEDLEKITSDIELTYATGTENFISLGENEIENPQEGEIVYKFSDTIICRNFNYRESEVTKLTKDTKKAILVMESVLEEDNLQEALEDLARRIQIHLGGSTKAVILKAENNEVKL